MTPVDVRKIEQKYKIKALPTSGLLFNYRKSHNAKWHMTNTKEVGNKCYLRQKNLMNVYNRRGET